MTSTPEKPLPSYLRTPNVPLHRAWNTWAADRYLDMIFQPLGVRVTPLLFSAAAGKALLPGPGHPVKLGAHSTDGSTVEAEVSHGGTVLDWSWGKLSAFDLAGGWKVRRHGEWGLRFWVVLVLTQEDGAVWRFDEERGIASTSVGPRTVAIKAERAPLLVTGHRDVASVAAEYESRGYWYLDSRSTTAPRSSAPPRGTDTLGAWLRSSDPAASRRSRRSSSAGCARGE